MVNDSLIASAGFAGALPRAPRHRIAIARQIAKFHFTSEY
jgi:hypothetical protein